MKLPDIKLPDKDSTLKSISELSQKATDTVKQAYNSDATKQVGRFAKWTGHQAWRGAQHTALPAAKLATKGILMPVNIVYRRIRRFLQMLLFLVLLGGSGYIIYTIDEHPRIMGFWAARNIANAEVESLASASYEVNLKQLKDLQDTMEQHPYEQVVLTGAHASDLVKTAFAQVVGVAYVFALDDEAPITVFAKAVGPFLEKSVRAHSVEYLAHVLKNAKRWLWIKQKISRHDVMDIPTIVIHFKPHSSRNVAENLGQLEHTIEMVSKHQHSCRVLLLLEDRSLVKILRNRQYLFEVK